MERTLNFTQVWLDSVKVEKGRTVFHDTRVRGLGLRVSATGRRVWQVLYREKGDKTTRVKDLGTFPPIGLKEARAKAGIFLGELEQGITQDPVARERKAKNTFKALTESYIELYAKPRKRSWEEDDRILKRDVLPVWEKRKAKDIKRRDVIALLDSLVASGQTTQANRTLACVRKLFNWAISRDLIDANPCSQVKAPVPEKQRERVLSESEIKTFWATCEGMKPLIAANFRLRLVTAQRGGEVSTMRWVDLDLDNGWWTIPAERTKNKLSHRVPLSDMALAILQGLQPLSGGSAWVFPSRYARKSYMTDPREQIEKLQKALPDFTLHDLRRTAASHMAGMGVPRLTIGKVLNHVEPGVTAVYDRHGYDKEKREALDVWASHLSTLIKTV